MGHVMTKSEERARCSITNAALIACWSPIFAPATARSPPLRQSTVRAVWSARPPGWPRRERFTHGTQERPHADECSLPVARRVVLEEAAIQVFAEFSAHDGVIHAGGSVDEVERGVETLVCEP